MATKTPKNILHHLRRRYFLPVCRSKGLLISLGGVLKVGSQKIEILKGLLIDTGCGYLGVAYSWGEVYLSSLAL